MAAPSRDRSGVGTHGGTNIVSPRNSAPISRLATSRARPTAAASPVTSAPSSVFAAMRWVSRSIPTRMSRTSPGRQPSSVRAARSAIVSA